jgi:pimeloyl-ACP methyl ester carboxylesterase
MAGRHAYCDDLTGPGVPTVRAGRKDRFALRTVDSTLSAAREANVRRTVHTSDGRALAVEDRGDPAGWPVLVHHGNPSSRHSAVRDPYVRDAAERGLRLIGYDRPGFGESSPQPGRTVADTAADVRAICAELGIDRMLTWGYSGGGPPVLACAALLPDLVTAAASLAGLAPFDAQGLDWSAGMDQDDVDFTRLFLTDRAAARKKLDKDREEFLADAAANSFAKDGLAPGSQGWWDENSMQLQPWGFDVADIAIPVLLLHGRKDQFVPPGHGEWLAAHIPGVEARWFDDDRHDTITNHVSEVHAWLSEHR